jgi:hypothetical protein
MDYNPNPLDISLINQEHRNDEEIKSQGPEHSIQTRSQTNNDGAISTVPETHMDNHGVQDIDNLEAVLLERENRLQRKVKKLTFFAIFANFLTLFLSSSPMTIYISFSKSFESTEDAGVVAILLSSMDVLACFTLLSILIIGFMERDWETKQRIK